MQISKEVYYKFSFLSEEISNKTEKKTLKSLNLDEDKIQLVKIDRVIVILSEAEESASLNMRCFVPMVIGINMTFKY